MTIRKSANQTSEQTFRLRITASTLSEEPGVIRPSTIQQSSDPTERYDYSFGNPGQLFITRDIFPDEQSVTINFTLAADELPEGLEGFRLTLSNFGGIFPPFVLPDSSSTTMFESSRIEIIDNDCK